jgi:GABA(A) receptor-associated protein
MNFKQKYTFKERLFESSNILQKYSDRIPIICEKNINNKNTPELDKNKYLVPVDLTIGQFIYVIRKRMKLPPEQGIFIFIGNTIPTTTQLLCDLYFLYKDQDGFLYITYSNENTFG